MFKPIMQQTAQELGIGVNYVDAEYNSSLAEKYSVSSVPTIIVADPSGNVVYRNSGVMSKEQLFAALTKFR
jgi:thioredoxin-related protein